MRLESSIIGWNSFAKKLWGFFVYLFISLIFGFWAKRVSLKSYSWLYLQRSFLAVLGATIWNAKIEPELVILARQMSYQLCCRFSPDLGFYAMVVLFCFVLGIKPGRAQGFLQALRLGITHGIIWSAGDQNPFWPFVRQSLYSQSNLSRPQIVCLWTTS